MFYEYARAHGAPLPDSKEVVYSILPIASFSKDDYYDSNTFVWQYGRRQGLEGEELRKKVDDHRRAGHAEIDDNLEKGRLTPDEAEKGKKDWDRKHGYRG